VTQVQRVADIIAEVTSSSNEQSQGVEQVNQAVTALDQATQQNAALVEQTAAATASLRAQAQNLAMAVSTFKV
jgi:methyl-accepting chemotaxis protein